MASADHEQVIPRLERHQRGLDGVVRGGEHVQLIQSATDRSHPDPRLSTEVPAFDEEGSGVAVRHGSGDDELSVVPVGSLLHPSRG
jgi:hypothetical protein